MRKGMENFIVVVCRAVYTMHFFHQPFFLKYLFQSFSLIWKNYWKRMQNKFPCWFKLQAPTIYIQINRTLRQQVMHPYCKVIYTKYSKHWPYTVAHTFDCVCSKMNISWFNPWFSFYFSSWYPAPYIEWYMC